jgi:phosphatidylglycerol lysyltransferase
LSVSKSDLIPYLEKYGSHCMAYTSLEPGMEYFLVDGMGYIAFISYRHWLWSRAERQIVLADPVCDEKNYDKIVALFIRKYPNAIFVQSSKMLAQVIDLQGYQVNQFGIETEIPVANFELAGKQRAKLRQWRNKCQREGVIIDEKAIGDCQNLAEIKALSLQWLSKKGGSEYSFLVRPLRYQTEKDVRYFWAYQNQRLVGFATFDPIYSNGNIIAYYHNIDRIDDSAPHGTSASIVLHALEVFRHEGLDFVSLGMSPLCLQRGFAAEFKFNKFTRKSFWYAFEKLNFIYPFQGNASHKNKFHGEKKPVYISSTKGTGLWQVLVMMKAIGMF